MQERPEGPGRAVAITSLGVVTALGRGVEAFWKGALSGERAFAPATRFRPSVPGVAAEIPPELLDGAGPGCSPPATRLALSAAREALAGGGPLPEPRRLGVVVGTSMGGNGAFVDWVGGAQPPAGGRRSASLHSIASGLAAELGARGPALCVSVACASGTVAVGLGADLIRSGECDAVLAGGVDLLSPFVYAGFDSLRALSPTGARPFDRRRDGLTLGEGTAFLLLEEAGLVRTAGRSALALLRGYGSAADAHHMTRPSPSGEGLVRAVEAALADASVDRSEIGFVSAHGTATRFNDRMEAAAFGALFGERAGRLPTHSIKGAIGHTLGAAGAIEALLSTLVLERGAIPPTAGFEEPDPECALDVVSGRPRILAPSVRFVLSTSSAFAGTNAALVLERA